MGGVTGFAVVLFIFGFAWGVAFSMGWYNTEFLDLMCGFPDFGCFKAWVLGVAADWWLSASLAAFGLLVVGLWLQFVQVLNLCGLVGMVLVDDWFGGWCGCALWWLGVL